MEQFKRAKAIMLPTNKGSIIIENNKLYLVKDHNGNVGEWINIDHTKNTQHIYIISDDEIKEGDWFMNDMFKLFKADIQYITSPYRNECTNHKKIIATTDTSLMTTVSVPHIGGQPNRKMLDVIKLPQPSQQFIEKYIEEYNKENIITNVLVEYIKEYSDDGTFSIINNPVIVKEILKINPKDNTITIKKIKNSWSREELELNLMNCVSELAAQFGHTPTASEMQKWNEATTEWIKENL